MEITTLSVFVGTELANAWKETSTEKPKARVDVFSNYKVCTGLKVHRRPTGDQFPWKGIDQQGGFLSFNDIIS